MKIGMIGPGTVGKGLADRWATHGHEIFFSFSRSDEKLRGYALELGERGHWGAPDQAVDFAEVVVLCCKWPQLAEALDALGDLGVKILIETVNSFRKDGTIEIGHTTSVAEQIAAKTGSARVVPAFNTIPATLLQEPEDLLGDRPPAVPYCGDDDDAKAVAASLIRDAGFDPVDTGPLKSARLIEPFAMLTVQAGMQIHTRNVGFAFLRPQPKAKSKSD